MKYMDRDKPYSPSVSIKEDSIVCHLKDDFLTELIENEADQRGIDLSSSSYKTQSKYVFFLTKHIPLKHFSFLTYDYYVYKILRK